MGKKIKYQSFEKKLNGKVKLYSHVKLMCGLISFDCWLNIKIKRKHKFV